MTIILMATQLRAGPVVSLNTAGKSRHASGPGAAVVLWCVTLSPLIIILYCDFKTYAISWACWFRAWPAVCIQNLEFGD